MQRTIVTPAALAPAALAELKQWLGITIAADDVSARTPALRQPRNLRGIHRHHADRGGVRGSVAARLGLASSRHSAGAGDLGGLWHFGGGRPSPVRGRSLCGGTSMPMAGAGCASPGQVMLRASPSASPAGLAPDWDALPDGLRHGVMRLAAHQHRQREGDGAAPLPPAAVAALWRPWRRLRLA